MGENSWTVTGHFEDREPNVRKIYDKILASVRKFGPVKEEAHKTSIHLVNQSALAGVETRKGYLLLNIKGDHEIKSPRIVKTERISAGRVHHKVQLASPQEVDKELVGWLKEAFEFSA